MWRLAWRNVRTRPSRFVGSAVALALGVALLGATGLVIWSRPAGPAQSRVTADVIVVRVDPVLHSSDPDLPDDVPLGAVPGLPSAVVTDLIALPGAALAVVDRRFEAIPLGPDGPVSVPDSTPVGHGWASAAAGPYRLIEGMAPSQNDDVVLDGRLATAGDWSVGEQVPVLTEAGVRPFRLAGITASVDVAEAAVFVSDTRASQLAPAVAGVLLRPLGGDVDRLAEEVRRRHPELQVLSGARVRRAQTEPMAEAYLGLVVALSTMASISAFVAIFVVAGTVALAITQRRRELALLRAVGATPGQVRRLVLAEAVVVGAGSAVLGCLAAVPVGHLLVGLLRRVDLAPPHMSLRVSMAPLLIAAGIGIVVSLAGVWLSARRARRVRPAEALREAAVESRAMTWSRWVIGIVALGGGIVMVSSLGGAGGSDRLAVAVTVGQVLVIGVAAWAPALVGPIIRWGVRPVIGLAGRISRAGATIAEVAAANLASQARRTAAVAGPALLMAGMAGSFLVAIASLEHSADAQLRDQLSADLVLVPAGTPGLTADAMNAAAHVAEVASVAAYRQSDLYQPGPSQVRQIQAVGVSTVDVAAGGPRLRVREGSLNALTEDNVIVTAAEADSRHSQVGDQMAVVLDDGTRARLTVSAIVDGGLADGAVYVSDRLLVGHTAPWDVSYATVRLSAGADRATVAEALSDAVAAAGAGVVDPEQWLARRAAEQRTNDHNGLLMLLGMAGVYTVIAIVNTLTMAVQERRRDLAQFRLAGATMAQSLGTMLAEGVLVTAVGLALGALVTAIAGVSLAGQLAGFGAGAGAAVPWSILIAVAGTVAFVIIITGLAAARTALRRCALDALAVLE